MPKNKVLIIEDDTRLLRALSYYLRQRDFEVIEATDGSAGMQAYRQHNPDLLVVDNSLPNKMGYEICADVRNEGGAELPIIMISAFMKVLGLELDQPDDDLVDHFLRKPFQLEQLWHTIERFRRGNGFARAPVQKTNTKTDLDLKEPFPLPLEGNLKDTPFLEILATALEHQVTGILTLREDSRIRRVYLANGFPAFARSNLITENLLRFLLRLGEITTDTYRKHLSKMQQERWRPGATLVREGSISLTRLNRTHRLLVEEILQVCIDWSTASFDFQPSNRPVEQAVIYDINPFKLIDKWLEDSFDTNQLLTRLQPLLQWRLSPSEHLDSWLHLLDWTKELDAQFTPLLQQSDTVVDMLGATEKERLLRGRLIQSVLLLGAVKLSNDNESQHSFLPKILHNLMTSSIEQQEDFRSFSPAAAEPQRSASKVSNVAIPVPPQRLSEDANEAQRRRIYDVVLRDFRRVLDRSSPYEALRVSRNDPLDVIRRRYERFERFYRPENFQRLGDSKLYRLAVEIRQALARSMAEIEAEQYNSGLSNSKLDSNFGNVSWLESHSTKDPLANIFFNDGLTYLRIAEFGEAEQHFKRAAKLEKGNAMYRAYILWTLFLAEDRSQEAAQRTREKLEQLISHNPNEDTPYHFLAHIHREEGNLEKAVAYYRKAAELNPDNRSARLFLQRLAGAPD